MADLKNALSVLKFNAYQTPDFTERKGKDYILFGEKNDYPDYLIKLYQRSPKHNAIISGKVDYTIGQGWAIQGNLTDEKLKGKAEMFINSPNQEENLSELSEKLSLDLELFGGFAVEVSPAKGTKNPVVSHLPFHRLRTNLDCSEFYYTRKWDSIKPEKNEDYRVLKAYDGTKGVFYYMQYSPKTSEYPVYPLPEYIGCIPYIEIDYEIANFHLNNIKNSFWGSFLINFYNGIPTEEEQQAIEKKIKKKFAGTDNAGRFILNFSDGKDTGSEMQPLTPNDMDKLFAQLNQTVQQEIFTGHKVTSPMLFGIKTEGQLGGRAEIVEAYELFKATYITNRQKQIEDTMNFLLTGNRNQRLVTLVEKAPIVVQLPISEATVDRVLTEIEIREDLKSRFSLDITPNIPKGQPTLNVNLPSPATKPPTAAKTFASEEEEDNVIAKFAEIGRPASEFNILKARRVWFSLDEAREAERKLMKQCFAAPVGGKIDDLSLKILSLLDKDPSLTPEEIANQLNIKPDEADKVLKTLIEADYLERNGKSWEITDAGNAVLPPVDEPVTSISIKYRYAKDPMVPGPTLLPTSRPFCKKIIGFDKLYDRREIEQISSEEGYSVFMYRGGWYHNPKTGDNTKYCRHIWEQVVVTEKRKA